MRSIIKDLYSRILSTLFIVVKIYKLFKHVTEKWPVKK